MTDNHAHARTILERTAYAVLATADHAGTPWATPVWFAPEELDRLYWVSWPGSRHSLLIDERPELAITVFDSTVVPGDASAFYARGRARQCPEDDLDHGLAIFNRRARAQGIDEFARDRVTGAARLRLYVAEIAEAWVLDQDAPVDQRAPVER